MAKFKAWVIHKEYYRVEVEADNWEHAKEKLLEVDLSFRKPDDYDFDFYDLEEAV
jgi:hypothetical protein